MKELPQSSCREIASPMPVSIDTKVDDSTDDRGVEIKVTETFQPCPTLALPHWKEITTMKATMDNLNMLYGSQRAYTARNSKGL